MAFNIDELGKNLTGKLGPLPGYAWVIIGVGGIYYYRKKHPSTAAATSTSPAAPPINSSTPVDMYGNPIDPNAAANQLYQSSPYTLQQIQDAIQAGLDGSSLNTTQQAIQDQLQQIQYGLSNPSTQVVTPSVVWNPLTPTALPTPAVTNNPGVTPAPPTTNNPTAPVIAAPYYQPPADLSLPIPAVAGPKFMASTPSFSNTAQLQAVRAAAG